MAWFKPCCESEHVNTETNEEKIRVDPQAKTGAIMLFVQSRRRGHEAAHGCGSESRADARPSCANLVNQRRTSVDKGEPPSCNSKFRQFLIGKNSRGNWVVRDRDGLCGGLFIDCTEALKFAMFENGNRPQAVIMVPDILELDMSGTPARDNYSAAEVHQQKAA